MSNQSNTSNDKPWTVQDIIREIEQKSTGSDYIYRGEPQCYDRVSSNLWREYADIDPEHFDIEVIQGEILEDAKKYEGKTDEEEILTEIQHYGGKTNLIDFTRNYYIALFFACEKDPHKDGRVILQEIDVVKSMIMKPRGKINRVVSQESIFIRPPRGFIEIGDDDVITIPKDLKLPMQEYLRKERNLSSETLYNDIHAYIENQRIPQNVATEFYRGLTSAKQKEYQKAIEHYTNSLKLGPDSFATYNNRGVAYAEKGEIDKAIKDYDKAIELNPNCADTHNNCGLIYYNKGDVDIAIKYFNEAIELNPNYADAYNNRGTVYKKKGEDDLAMADHNEA
ncbi:tetratricopeptide repeat protein, partial [Candidatus Poribacteria bacterium]|nr:tetratricopeptide repeat protein [Candidatus Poribacteria bacterium]